MERHRRFARNLAFVLTDGNVVYPVRQTNRETWVKTFRVGLSSNAQDDILEVEHEEELIVLILRRRCAVRCASDDGSRKGLFSADHHQVTRVVIRDHELLGV